MYIFYPFLSTCHNFCIISFYIKIGIYLHIPINTYFLETCVLCIPSSNKGVFLLLILMIKRSQVCCWKFFHIEIYIQGYLWSRFLDVISLCSNFWRYKCFPILKYSFHFKYPKMPGFLWRVSYHGFFQYHHSKILFFGMLFKVPYCCWYDYHRHQEL